MKKIFVTLFGILCCLNFTNVKAAYNGEGGVFVHNDGNKECEGSNCQYDNFNRFYVKLTLYYIDNGNFETIEKTKSFYVTSTSYKNYLTTSLGVPESSVYTLPKKWQDKLDKISNTDSKRYEKTSNLLKDCFGDQMEKIDNIRSKNLKDFLNKATGGDYESVLTKDTENANRNGLISEGTAAKKGYRLVIEPAIAYTNATWANGGGGILTVKGTAQKRVSGVSFRSYSLPLIPGEGDPKQLPQSQFLQTSFDDVGIKAQSEGYCEKKVTLNQLADLKNGCGYNIIDIGRFIKHYCYYKNVEDGKLKCVNKDQNNNGDFKETYTKKECSTEEYKTNTNTKYGRLIKKIDNCSVYCIESATASFPGHISKTLQLESFSQKGNYFTWPSRIGTNGMKMYMKTKLTCHIRNNDGKTCSEKNIESLQKAVKSELDSLEMKASLKAGTNKEIDGSLVSYIVKGQDIEYKNKETTTYTDGYRNENWNNVKVNKKEDGEVWSNKFSIEKKIYFKIPNDKNRLYNKESGNVFDGIASTGKNIYDRKEGVVSLLSDQDTKPIYNLEIKNVQLGAGNQFGTLIDEYKCNYRITTQPPCACPEGTVMEGTSLYDKLTEGKTCAELQETLCNVCTCPPNAANQYEKELVGEEATTAACKKLQDEKCYNYDYCTFNGKQINLTSCIDTKMKENGLTKVEASTYCEQMLCPECTDSYGIKHDLSACLETGRPYILCEQKYCPGQGCIDEDCYECSQNCKWTLKEKTKTTVAYKKRCDDGENCGYIKMSCPAGNENMLNADSCIKTQLKDDLKGNSVADGLTKGLITDADVRSAFAACEEKVCPYSGSKIIYRQIDLNDPFPGKNHKGTGETKYSNNNQNVKSRKPGENWNSDDVIKTRILEARGVKGYELYNKDPLYIIVLTPDTMKKIREYNSKNKYDDFELTCTNINKTSHCISDFLHKGIGNLNPSDFIKPSYGNKNSVNACYNMDYSEGSFNNCYNENN